MSGPGPLLLQPFTAPARCEVPLPVELANDGWTAEKWNDLLYDAVCGMQELEYLSGKMFYPMTSKDADAIKAEMSALNRRMETRFMKANMTDHQANALMMLAMIYPGLKQYVTAEQAASLLFTGTATDIAHL